MPNAEGKRLTFENARFLEKTKIDTASLATQADRLRADGEMAIFVGIDGRVAGALAISDPVKPTTAGAPAALCANGIKVMMLTGDNHTAAEAAGANSRSMPSRPMCCSIRKRQSSRG
jgi:Cu+-exporting ATPase